jgi:hypothetical protein
MLDVPLSLHKYAYAHNDPVNQTDPSGNYLFGLVDISEAALLRGLLAVTVGVALYPVVRAGVELAAEIDLQQSVAEMLSEVVTIGAANGLATVYTAVATNATILAKITQAQSQAAKNLRTRLANAANPLRRLFFVFGSLPYPATPCIYNLDAAAQAFNVGWITLTYMRNPAAARLNRLAAAALAPSMPACGLPPRSMDEYPYASTLEGGSPFTFTAQVPVWENALQGGLLGSFYRFIMRAPGPFLVILVP